MTKLKTVEMARGLAACSVVAFHANASAAFIGLANSPMVSPLQYGVDFFFVLSGFIIFHVHRDEIGNAGSALPYLIKRIIRLYPLLWLVVGGWIILRIGAGKVPTIGEIGTSLLLYPSLEFPVPLVVWTLRHAILFYLAFFLAIFSRKAGVALFSIWTLAVLFQMAMIAWGNPLKGMPSLVLSSYVLDFILGAIVAYAANRWRVRSWWPLLIGIGMVGTVSWASLEFGWNRLDTLDYTSEANLFVPLLGLSFAVTLFGLLCIEDMVEVPQWAVLMGGASYAIYLVHTPVNSVIQHFAAKLGEGLGHLFIFCGGIMAGIILHVLIERRLTRFLRFRLLERRG